MGFWDARPRIVTRRSDDEFVVELNDGMRTLLGDLVGQLRELLSTDSPALARLFPPPYGDDEERNEGYAALAGSELIENRLARLEVVSQTVRSERLTEAELLDWMRSINDLRLVLGTILGIDDDHVDARSLDPDDVDAPTFMAYDALGELLEHIVAALSD